MEFLLQKRIKTKTLNDIEKTLYRLQTEYLTDDQRLRITNNIKDFIDKKTIQININISEELNFKLVMKKLGYRNYQIVFWKSKDNPNDYCIIGGVTKKQFDIIYNEVVRSYIQTHDNT